MIRQRYNDFREIDNMTTGIPMIKNFENIFAAKKLSEFETAIFDCATALGCVFVSWLPTLPFIIGSQSNKISNFPQEFVVYHREQIGMGLDVGMQMIAQDGRTYLMSEILAMLDSVPLNLVHELTDYKLSCDIFHQNISRDAMYLPTGQLAGVPCAMIVGLNTIDDTKKSQLVALGHIIQMIVAERYFTELAPVGYITDFKIMEMLAKNCTNEQIIARLELSEYSLKTSIVRIQENTDSKSRSELALLASRYKKHLDFVLKAIIKQ